MTEFVHQSFFSLSLSQSRRTLVTLVGRGGAPLFLLHHNNTTQNSAFAIMSNDAEKKARAACAIARTHVLLAVLLSNLFFLIVRVWYRALGVKGWEWLSVFFILCGQGAGAYFYSEAKGSFSGADAKGGKGSVGDKADSSIDMLALAIVAQVVSTWNEKIAWYVSLGVPAYAAYILFRVVADLKAKATKLENQSGGMASRAALQQAFSSDFEAAANMRNRK